MSEQTRGTPVEVVFCMRSTPIRRQTKTGATVASITGVEKNGRDATKITKIALFDKAADDFLAAFEQQANERGEDPETFLPIITLTGNWKRTEWRDKVEWEFWGRSFVFC